jgi:hypothetical protein
VDNFLRFENRHTGEILRLRRVRVAEGQIVLTIDGSLPPRRSGPPVHLDRYLQALFVVFNANVSGRPSIFYRAHVLWRHRH